MRWLGAVVLLVAALLCGACGGEGWTPDPPDLTPPAAAVPSQSPSAPEVGPEGDPHVGPSAYSWLNSYRPDDTYTIVVARGIGPADALRILGPVARRLGRLTAGKAQGYVYHRINRRTYETPTIVQVGRRAGATVLYLPSGFIADRSFDALSRDGIATQFCTTVELDTYVSVARHGHMVRQFDAGWRPPRKGALPQENGLDWGARHQRIWATAWAYMERLDGAHISREWFDGKHPTYLLTRSTP